MTRIESFLFDLEQAERSGDLLLIAGICLEGGKIYLERNIYPEAIPYFQRAARIFSEHGRSFQLAQSLNQLSVCLLMSNQADLAIENLSRAKELLTEIDHPALSAAIEGNIGLAYSELMDHAAAAKHHKSVQEIARSIDDPSLELNALVNLADCNLRDQNLQSAQGFALVALDLAKSLDSQSSLIIIYDMLGMITSHQGDLKSALNFHQQAYQTAREIGDLLRQGIALANQALAQEGLMELDQAYQLMSEAQEIFVHLNADYQSKTRKDLSRIQLRLSGVD